MQASTTSDTGGLSEFVDLAISAPMSATAAARMLDQTTFGPTTSLIQQVQQEGVTAVADRAVQHPADGVADHLRPTPPYCAGTSARHWCEIGMVADAPMTGNDQLRQRVAFALSELFVISSDTSNG